ncbi:hypothetical protein Fmac_024093 [Flemingia macrophylla]|uniref:Uncharacterized protein n=1 Tax=Flemingia macrophylla TaxID=520843 RepID=A0ABD1LNE2_9FABA
MAISKLTLVSIVVLNATGDAGYLQDQIYVTELVGLVVNGVNVFLRVPPVTIKSVRAIGI